MKVQVRKQEIVLKSQTRRKYSDEPFRVPIIHIEVKQKITTQRHRFS
jgi:disulfide oxidoreductase YuzD|tara:strand:- start:411 stop:551 length:141 start_codon:yes stop_codon:yes gene_type:complete